MYAAANTVRARALGTALREARQGAGPEYTLAYIGGRLGRSHTDVSRWETGRRVPSEADVIEFLDVIGVRGIDRDMILRKLHEAEAPNLVLPGIRKSHGLLMEDEKTAVRVVNVQTMFIPGWLQTEEYARAAMVAAGSSRAEIDQRVAVRLSRQAILHRENGPDFVAVIGEFALRYPPCGPDVAPAVMVEQLGYLSAQSKRPNVTIRVLPMAVGYTPAMEGPFVYLTFPVGKPVVHLEHYRASALIANDKDVRDYGAAVDVVLGQSMDVDASAAFIDKVKSEWERACH